MHVGRYSAETIASWNISVWDTMRGASHAKNRVGWLGVQVCAIDSFFIPEQFTVKVHPALFEGEGRGKKIEASA